MYPPQRHSCRRWAIGICLNLTLASLVSCASRTDAPPSLTSTPASAGDSPITTPPPPTAGASPGQVKLLFVGDVMQHRTQILAARVPSSSGSARQAAAGRATGSRTAAAGGIGSKSTTAGNTETYDYHASFAQVQPYFAQADWVLGNLELTLAGPPYTGYPRFSAPDAIAEALHAVGVHVLVTANNHAADKGRKGVERTITVLDTLGIQHTGSFLDLAERKRKTPLLLAPPAPLRSAAPMSGAESGAGIPADAAQGFRIALLNYTFGLNGLPVHAPHAINRIDLPTIQQDIDTSYAQALAHQEPLDALIVFLHWGEEYQRRPNTAQQVLARAILQAVEIQNARTGHHTATLVIGAHPHVLQPIEWRSPQQLVVYSLGNFISGQRKPYTEGGVMVEVTLTRAAGQPTQIDAVRYLPTWVRRAPGGYTTVLPAHRVLEGRFPLSAPERQRYRRHIAETEALYTRYNTPNVTLREPLPSAPASAAELATASASPPRSAVPSGNLGQSHR